MSDRQPDARVGPETLTPEVGRGDTGPQKGSTTPNIEGGMREVVDVRF